MIKYIFNIIIFFWFLGCSNSKDITLIDINSEDLLNKINYFKNEKAVLLNVWALWCKPCIEEFPMIVSLDREFEDLEVIFVSADFNDQREDVKKFLKTHNVLGESYIKVENDESFINNLLDGWDGTLPFTIVFSKSSGNIVDFWVGKKSELYFRSTLIKALDI